VLKEEHRLYTEAVRIVLEGRYRMDGRRVLLTNLAAGAEKR
jgi:folate-dependent phosphoribosylglycinamide formyltransferase PurN